MILERLKAIWNSRPLWRTLEILGALYWGGALLWRALTGDWSEVLHIVLFLAGIVIGGVVLGATIALIEDRKAVMRFVRHWRHERRRSH